MKVIYHQVSLKSIQNDIVVPLKDRVTRLELEKQKLQLKNSELEKEAKNQAGLLPDGHSDRLSELEQKNQELLGKIATMEQNVPKITNIDQKMPESSDSQTKLEKDLLAKIAKMEEKLPNFSSQVELEKENKDLLDKLAKFEQKVPDLEKENQDLREKMVDLENVVKTTLEASPPPSLAQSKSGVKFQQFSGMKIKEVEKILGLFFV